ncbi:Signal transduction response regulator, receiver domain-containing protein [Desulfonema limicola]|uniref:Signal transduction response regulator, receiver domain-containing protein n=1 Tax=Desulfonema limicola TaxID=45656 RepID=A0A975B367_9BACT|nr:response regulator [Desulfonema limicola]QTA77947.1 Signal transduction response regulator, receiver domain-containing protein [Desulfonema limicola]
MPKTIMVVEDVTSMRGLVAITLNTAGYHVVEACNGEDALKRLAEQKVHMIISDVNMPSMNGLEFLKIIKSNPDYKFIPVVMLTTQGDETTKKKGQMAGAKAWIVKPFKPESILKVVQKIIG